MKGNFPAPNSRTTELTALLERALGERMDELVERVFRLLGLIHPPEEMHATYLSHHAKPELRASAIEFLDNVLDPPLKDWVVPLLDEGDMIVEAPGQDGVSSGASLQVIMAGNDRWLRTIAAELAKELNIAEPAGVEIHAEQ